MGKRKAADESDSFVWKKNIDIQLLTEVEQLNPYASSNQKPAWEEILENLRRDSHVPVNVTSRSCQERVADLLKSHRKGERISIQTSGVAAEKLTALQVLLTSISKLEEAKPNSKLKALFSTKDRDKAEAVRNEALEEIETDFSDFETSGESDDTSSDDYEVGPNKKAKGKNSNAKTQLVKHLQLKNDEEMLIRKEELHVRQEEIAIRAKEVEVQRMKAETEVVQNKMMMELLMKMYNPAE